ncbi:MAG: Ig domain-containing protein [Nanoarchaeota archaeon]|nr:Ig domain-containing protein [Nanoarchaeota archaeon]
MNKTFLFLVMFFLAMVGVNAVSILDVSWLDNNGNVLPGNTYTMPNGDDADFQLWANTATNLLPFNVHVTIWDENMMINDLIDEEYNGGDDGVYVNGINADLFVEYGITSTNYIEPGFYRLNIEVSDDLSTVTDELYLEVLGEENHAPEVLVIYPNGGETLTGIETIEYTATDADNDLLSIKIEISDDGGYLWNVIEDDLENTGYYTFDTNDYANGDEYLIRITAFDLYVSVSDVSDSVFTIYNEITQNTAPWFGVLPDQYLNMNSGFNNNLFDLDDYAYDNEGDELSFDILGQGNTNLVDCSIDNDNYLDCEVINGMGESYITLSVSDGEFIDVGGLTVYVNGFVNTPPEVSILSPTNTETISGVYDIEWAASDANQDDDTLNILIEYKEDNWWAGLAGFLGLDDWNVILASESNLGSYPWNTLVIDDGQYKMRITVTDDYGAEDQDMVLFRIDNYVSVNHDPIITSSSITMGYVGELYSYDVDAYDEDGDVLTYLLEELPDGMSINSNTGLITWAPSQEGNYPIKVKVIDGNGGEDTQEFTINVNEEEEPEPPVFTGFRRHKFLIENVIIKEKENYLDVYVNIKNKGSHKESVTLKAVIVQTGDTVYDNFNLDVHDGYWRFLRFNKPLSGSYVIRVDAGSYDDESMRYVTVKI